MLATYDITVGGTTYSDMSSAGKAIGDQLTKAFDEGMQQISVELQKALTQIYDKLEALHGAQWPASGSPFGTDPDHLTRRSGNGLRTIKDSISVTRSLTEIAGSISAGDLSVHEIGATIQAKNAKYLTIPLPAALDSRGVPIKAKARDWDNTFIARSKRGNLIIFQKNLGGGITPLYILKSEVTIKPRLGLGQAFDEMVPYFEAKAVDALERALAKWH